MLYGHQFKNLNNEFIDSELQNKILEEAFINGILEEGLEDFIDEDEIVEEGANIDSAKVFYEKVKEYKKVLKESKKALKEKDYELAQSKVKEASAILSEAKKEINKIPSTAGSAVIGSIAAVLETAVNALVVYFAIVYGIKGVEKIGGSVIRATGSKLAGEAIGFAGGGALGSITGTHLGKELSKVIWMVNNINKDIKKGKDKSETLNLYKQKLIASIDVLRTNTSNLSIFIKEKKKRDQTKNNK